jgi:hypothetical protein
MFLHFLQHLTFSIVIAFRSFFIYKNFLLSIPHQRWGIYDRWPLKGALSRSKY